MKCKEYVTLLLVYCFMQAASSETRCFCNEASCVPTSYMCKSMLGSCYTHTTLSLSSTKVKVTHGCVDSLSMLVKLRCHVTDQSQSRETEVVDTSLPETGHQWSVGDKGQPGIERDSVQSQLEVTQRTEGGSALVVSDRGETDRVRDSELRNGTDKTMLDIDRNYRVMADQGSSNRVLIKTDHVNERSLGPDTGHQEWSRLDTDHQDWSRFECCESDMCNYPVDIRSVSGDRRYAISGQLASDSSVSMSTSDSRSIEGDLWFKAAVICVPVLGLFILILLIIMAARMLRADRQHQVAHHERRRCLAQQFCTCGYVTAYPFLYHHDNAPQSPYHHDVTTKSSLVATITKTTPPDSCPVVTTVIPSGHFDLLLPSSSLCEKAACQSCSRGCFQVHRFEPPSGRAKPGYQKRAKVGCSGGSGKPDKEVRDHGYCGKKVEGDVCDRRKVEGKDLDRMKSEYFDCDKGDCRTFSETTSAQVALLSSVIDCCECNQASCHKHNKHRIVNNDRTQ